MATLPAYEVRQRLMGLPEYSSCRENYNEAYHLAGDGVVVPVILDISQRTFWNLFLPPPKRRKRK